jgi:[acyl-carrier-protein] S-malonyltransferase
MATIAFIFPGQGSQSVGMLSEFLPIYPQIATTFHEASTALGYDLWDLITYDKQSQLNETRFTQPAILTASIALWRIWRDQAGAKPDYLAGHSLGEYSALVASGALTLSDAVLLVSKRGEFMQEAVADGAGAMAAVLGLPDDEVIALCAQAAEQDVLSAVNFNAPGQVVIAGNKAAVLRALELVKAHGKRAMMLPVSVPSHCLLMKSAAEKLANSLSTITLSPLQIPIVNNVDVLSPQDSETIKQALIRQLYSPVRWSESIQAIAKHTSVFFECGPGKVLTGLNKRINPALTTYPLCDPTLFTTALNV